MEASIGERLRPLPARDARGRFVSPHAAAVQQPKPPPSEETLLWHFDLKGWCSFPDPWREGRYVIETRKSLKGFPVAMRYEGPLLQERAPEFSCVVKYDTVNFWNGSCPPGEVAVSPAPWYGDPREGWGNSEWQSDSQQNKRQLARLYIHLAHSVDLHTKSCGNRIGILKGHSRY